jgi:hypothetical protein
MSTLNLAACHKSNQFLKKILILVKPPELQHQEIEIMDLKKWYSIPGLILAGAFLIFAFTMVNKSQEASHEFKIEKNKIAEILNFKDRMLSFRDWVFSETAWEEKRVKFEETLQQADVHYNEALSYGYYLLFGCLIFLIVVVSIYARKRIYFGITLGLATVGLALLAQGIFNPILEIAAFEEDMTFKIYVKPKDIPYYTETIDNLKKTDDFLGSTILDNVKLIPWIGEDIAEFSRGATESVGTLAEDAAEYLEDNANEEFGKDQVFKGKTYFYYQNKGIMEVISLLWKTNNKPVALAIGLFSVIIPSLKLISSLIILLSRTTAAKRFRKILKFLAKWSMADVFVVAMFLAYLSFANMSAGVTMDTTAHFGLYYFMGYVVLSIALGFVLALSIKERKKHIEIVDNQEVASDSEDEKQGE